MEDLKKINGFRPPEIHTIIAWNGHDHAAAVEKYISTQLKSNFEVIYQKKIHLSVEIERRLAQSVYFKNASRAKKGCIYLAVIKDNTPLYEWRKATSCKQVLNINMKHVKEDMRLNIGGRKNAWMTIHTSYNIEEAIMVLEPLGLLHLITRPVFDDFKDLFSTLNADGNLKYAVQWSFDELNNPISFFKRKDVDILVNDYYYFKSITGARSVNKKHMRENDNGHHVQSTINISGSEVKFDIRFIGDNFIDPAWAKDLLSTRTHYRVNDNITIFVPDKINELYSLLYRILVQKPRPCKSKHIPRIRQLLQDLNKEDLHLESGTRSSKTALDDYMLSNKYTFTRPYDKSVRFNIQ